MRPGQAVEISEAYQKSEAAWQLILAHCQGGRFQMIVSSESCNMAGTDEEPLVQKAFKIVDEFWAERERRRAKP